MLPKMDHQVFKTLEGFENSKITIVEWETPLLRRLGYPLASKSDLIFMVPDNQIQDANDIATRNGLKLAGDDELPISYLVEFAKQGFRYVYGEPKSKFILLPLSWSGIEQDELSTITTDISLPCTIWTVPMPAFCAASLRIIMQEECGSRVRGMAVADLANVIAYRMFDMSYEGSYLQNPEDDVDDEAVGFQKDEDAAVLADKEASDMKNAVDNIRGWEFKKDGDWNRNTLIQLVTGKQRYDDLPSREPRHKKA
ncbi:hypothetical protein LX32DRAFT_579614 [Colletotrichum zoysiae]|uniref:Uncharacterized protein n=1 Tax=Colletotrichum zoysiae TaxID=1216348 RepID=A0AAD9HUF3_9PEZI|nr:hypothetical protein LX32DRAFT_579614 [Colletotrichum zoysiae]